MNIGILVWQMIGELEDWSFEAFKYVAYWRIRMLEDWIISEMEDWSGKGLKCRGYDMF